MNKSKQILYIIAVFEITSFCHAANLVPNGDFTQGFTGWTVINAYDTESFDPYAPNPRVFIATVDSRAGAAAAAGGLVIQAPMDADGSGVDSDVFEIGDANAYTLSYKFGYNNIGSVAAVYCYFYDSEDNVCDTYVSSSVDWSAQGSTDSARGIFETNPDPNPNDGLYNCTSWNTINGTPSIWLNKSIRLVRTSNYTLNSWNFVVPPNAAKAKISLRYLYTAWQAYFDDISFVPDAQVCHADSTYYLNTDMNKDCVTDLSDFAILASKWLSTGYTNENQ